MLKSRVTIDLPNGLEVRPLAMLVQVASQFKSATYIEYKNKHINAKSIMGMMTLGLDQGEEVVITSEGEDEEKAIEAITRYLTGQ